MKLRLRRFRCDTCPATTTAHPRLVEARWAAKRAGWHLADVDLCGTCAPARKDRP